ncbi:hypothetical protein PR048_017457, partial [Dryococelus australis]
MICVDNQPFSVVENQGFVRMMNVAEPKYKLPTRKHLYKTVVPEMYEKVKVKIENILEPVQYVSNMTNMWLSIANNYYLSITAHFLDDNYKMQHVCLECTQLHFFKESLDKWGLLEKLSYVVQDNARNMSATTENTSFKNVSCLAHTLQLVIKDSVFNQKEVSNVITTICRRLVGHFKHSVKYNKQLKAAQETLHMPQKCMIQDEPTRWNSTLHMSKRVLEQRRQLALVTPGLDLTNYYSFTKGKLYIERLTNDLLACLQRRFRNCEFDQCHVTATILDPRFKTKVFISNEAVIDAKQHILPEMDKLETSKISALSEEMESSNAANFTVSSNSSTNFNSNEKHAMWSMYVKLLENASSVHEHMVKSEDELQTYLNEPILLKKLTKCYLAIPPATVHSECFFSTAGLICDKKCNRLDPETVQKLVFLHKNLKTVLLSPW